MAFERRLVKASGTFAVVILTITVNFPLVGSQQQGEEKSRFMEGPAVFQSYCAVCHGKNAMGGGPAAAALKKKPPDLTRISERNGGIFPFERVQKIISGDGPWLPAHGSREMPIWGPIFDEISWDGAPGSFRIYNLTKYIQDLQQLRRKS